MHIDEIIGPPESKMLKSGKVTLSPGEEIGEHTTYKKEELIIVLQGTASLVKNNKVIELKEGETHYIREGIKHNIKNNSDQELKYMYIAGIFNKE